MLYFALIPIALSNSSSNIKKLSQISKNSIHADLKQFFLAGFPEEHLFSPPTNYGQGFLDGRLKFRLEGKNWSTEIHHVVTMASTSPTTQLEIELQNMGMELEESTSGSFMTGVGLQAPEIIKLSWKGKEESDLFLQGRTDRLYFKGSLEGLDVQIGRQPISFGNGFVFSPLDLVQPFSFATIDSEYKPGIDALRLDGYIGMSTQITAVAAYAGDWNIDGLTYVLNGTTTIGWTDISLFLGKVRSDNVLGVGVVSSIGSIGIHSDISYTLPSENSEDPFVRAVLGMMYKPFEKSTINSELYFQSLGKTDPKEYLEFSQSDRFARGEIWLMGQSYGSVAWSQEITPLVQGTVSVIGNLNDISMMFSPSLSISVSDSTQAAIGGFLGIGESPEDLELSDLTENPQFLNSEFGFFPKMCFVQMRSYF